MPLEIPRWTNRLSASMLWPPYPHPDSMEIPDTLAQRRLVDGLEYHFVRDGEHDGRPSYTRTDGMVLCRWHDVSGWVACSPDGIEN